MLDEILTPPPLRFDGFLNANLPGVTGGDTFFASFGPLPVDFPVERLLVTLRSTVPATQSTLTVRAGWSEKSFRDISSPTSFETLMQVIQSQLGVPTVGPSFTGSLDGSSLQFEIGIRQRVPASARLLIVMLQSDEDCSVSLSVFPGSPLA